MKPSYAAVLMLAPALWGCGRAPAEIDVQMKSATYYAKHLQEATQVANRCNQLNEQEQRRLSARDYQEWQMSNEWVNCQTAISVTDAAALRDSVLKQSHTPPAPLGANAALAP
ncbi:hypothetical protein [Rugamonas aquatica]|uniref:Uncharacterized protein n=1 Tax=Rugamonas aquatica TaxID=2743357 RepID=A0A6A7MWS5_9BURK|nr:hypothetical protein [Rugamonas aquatica]MQA37198.1 hypothetical protein [Rugamonas aquatica]